MIRNLSHLKGLTIGASNGQIGKVKDAYFDDSEWVVRYLIVDTGSWLNGRSVLISPRFIEGVNWERSAVQVALSRDQVQNSPDVDFDKPVSRQHEVEYYSHYRSFGYWAGPFVWGRLPYPGAGAESIGVPEHLPDRARRNDRNVDDAHLRSANEVQGYHIHALDGSIGHVEDFLFEDETWLIQSLVVDTRNWLPGKHVMVPPAWIEEVDWLKRAARVNASREAIRDRPEYPDDMVIRVGLLGTSTGLGRDGT